MLGLSMPFKAALAVANGDQHCPSRDIYVCCDGKASEPQQSGQAGSSLFEDSLAFASSTGSGVCSDHFINEIEILISVLLACIACADATPVK